MDTFITILSYIGAIILIGIIIMIHELGHYSIGRWCKIKIVEFAVGFGPKIKSWVKNGIIYSIRWLPLGGFTKFYGEDEEAKDTDSFNNQPAGKRALTIAAGPVFNVAFAFILSIIILVSFGEYSPTVGDVWEGSPAQEAGLVEGDVITSLDGVDLEFYMEVDYAKRQANNQYTELTVLRDGQELYFKIPKVYYEKIPEANRGSRTDEEMIVNNYMSGLTFGVERKSYGFFEAIGLTFRWIFVLFRETLIAIITVIAALFGAADRAVFNEVSGPIGMVTMIGEALKSSLENVLRLGVAISTSLAIFNLLPFPALDGGRLVFIGIEKATGKPVPRKIEGIIHLVGFVMLFGLMILIMYNDVSKWFGG